MNKWDYERATKSAKVLNAVTPVLNQYFGGKIITTERHESKIEQLLDYNCAIDALVETNKSIFGIAHRVKYNNYTDFTIRVYNPDGLTEIDHMRQSGIKPRYHVQTVCIDGKPTKIAIAKSMDLLYAIDILGLAKTKTAFSGCKFAILDWNKLMKYDINVDIINVDYMNLEF